MRMIPIAAGAQFGDLTTTGTHEIRHGTYYWECRCVCGRVTVVPGNALRRGTTAGCGCRARLTRNVTHGHCRRSGRAKEYTIWRAMCARCLKPTNNMYHLYGGRGISVCERWRTDFAAFLSDMGACPSPIHSIDRIDSDGHYEPGNCRWATPAEQSRNTKRNVRVSFRGREMALVEACELAGMPYSAVSQRLRVLGWPLERALSAPVRICAGICLTSR